MQVNCSIIRLYVSKAAGNGSKILDYTSRLEDLLI